jgi:CheY-like chemotaxis protein
VAITKAHRQFDIEIEKPVVKIGLKDVTVMCIDNDPDVLNGMIELLGAWHCNVLSADSFEQAKKVFRNHQNDIEILLVDYQLNNNQDGLTLTAELRDSANHFIPAILITATTESDIEERTHKANMGFMKKLVKPAALRAMMSAMLAKKLQDNYSE